MFIGREEEMELLQDLYASNKFEFLVLYGRRRVGKTSLLREFTKDKNSIYFSCQEKNDSLNLSDFSSIVQSHFEGSSYGDFSNWQSAFAYIGDKSTQERTFLVIDEFPYVALENPSIKSILQHTIDLSWKGRNIFLVLCGSSVSFMESEVLGSKSPLYGRATARLELKGFDYYLSSKFFPDYSNEEKLLAYGILGGIPSYLEQFDGSKPIISNLASCILRTGSFLKDEPQTLLKMEVRDPGVYNRILETIAEGSSRMSVIADKIHEETQKCSKYLSTLQTIKIVEKIVPAGESDKTKKSIYRICDNFFQFWYRFLFRNNSHYEIIGAKASADEIMDADTISTYMGSIFERICCEYMLRLAKTSQLPIVPYHIGRWWGANPTTRKQDDVDILVLGKNRDEAIFCECKYRNVLFDKSEFDDLVTASKAFSEAKTKFYYLFSKSGFSQWVHEEAEKREDVKLVGLDDLFAF